MVGFWKIKYKIDYQEEMLQQEGIGLIYRKKINLICAIFKPIDIFPHTRLLKITKFYPY